MWAYEVTDGSRHRPAGYIGTYPSRAAAVEARSRLCRSGGYIRRVSWEPTREAVEALRNEAGAAGDLETARDCDVVLDWRWSRDTLRAIGPWRGFGRPRAAERRICEVIADAAHAAGEPLP